MTKEQLINSLNKGIQLNKHQISTELKMFVKDVEFNLERIKSFIKEIEDDSSIYAADASITETNNVLLSAQTAIEHINILQSEMNVRKRILDDAETLN